MTNDQPTFGFQASNFFRHSSLDISHSRLLLVLTLVLFCASLRAEWTRHTIDDSSRGADGVRVSDANGDRLPDLTTGWEEGGVIRVYLNPGPEKATHAWPAVTVGRVKSPEDAVFADLDGDGSVDVVSSCEGKTRSIFVHWAPQDPKQYLTEEAWTTQVLPCAQGKEMWMFAVPLQADGAHGTDLIVGSKGGSASVSLLQAPKNPRNVDAWKLHRLYDAGWIMSLQLHDMNADGDHDVLVSDRKGPTRGVLWLENPGGKRALERWPTHRLGGEDREVMFLSRAPRKSDYPNSVFAAVRGSGFSILSPPNWTYGEIAMPENCGTGKGIAVADIDLNGRTDLVFSCENAAGHKSGVRWLSRTGDAWKDHEISGPEGVKFDRLEILDLDQDGDLDVVTCEERANLGVIWYENPTR
ncbi:MAG: hypothetical protein CMJ64_01810 [Planctomycetaceae bacterium]|nr:hypothetical protein [Planctomycetaceae bacterium]